MTVGVSKFDTKERRKRIDIRAENVVEEQNTQESACDAAYCTRDHVRDG